MQPKLTKLWTDRRAGEWGSEQTLRADFSNDRHYEAVIRLPCEAQQIAEAMIGMANMIARDPHLTHNVKLRG
jgi:hypothetical protein